MDQFVSGHRNPIGSKHFKGLWKEKIPFLLFRLLKNVFDSNSVNLIRRRLLLVLLVGVPTLGLK
jgi:hypothetical protein